mmetsp:Transcript_32213/g.49268  ORF Transcript_32213/g.49268 Transcript_32213/m.49268 type:complete len:134 (-) Transcript_32213:469-870(-)
MKRSTMKFTTKPTLEEKPQKGRKKSTNYGQLDAPLIEAPDEQGPHGKLQNMISGFMKKINPVKKKDNLLLDVDDSGTEGTTKKEPNSTKAKKSFEFLGIDAEAKGTFHDRPQQEEGSEQGDFTLRLNFLQNKV